MNLWTSQLAGVLLVVGAPDSASCSNRLISLLGFLRGHSSLAVLVLLLLVSAQSAVAQFSISTAPGGMTIVGAAGIYTGRFGAMNALGIGTPANGVSVIPLSNGALYYTPFNITVPNLQGSHKGIVTAYVSSNFAHPAALIAEGCPYNSTCNASSGYSVLSLNAGAPTSFVPAPGLDNQTVTAGLALFIPDNNGASAYAGSDSAQITFNCKDATNGHNAGTLVLSLTLPQSVQTAVQLTLSTAPGGATITPSADFSLSFGNVNALGIGPGAGFTTTSVAGGVIYHTPYLLNPAFSAMSSTTGTIKVYVSTNFAHPAVLTLDDASAANGPYNAISTNVGAQTQITNAAANRSSITRYVGLFVSNINGPSAFTGADNATLTFTLTVP